MKVHTLIFFFLTVLCVKGYSQTDTSSLNVLYKDAENKKIADKISKRKIGCSYFFGLGYGGNKYKSGFARGADIGFHYNMHTINIYTSLASKSEELYSKDYTNTLHSRCLGIMYGIGAYEKNVSASLGIGVGYCQTSIDFHTSLGQPTYTNYNEVGFCFGGQLTFHTKFVGLTFRGNSNISHSISSYTILVGIKFILEDIKQGTLNNR